MNLKLANALVTRVLAICNKENKNGVVAVVDRGGNLVALQRNDNIGPHSTLAAQKKSCTSLSTKSDSRELVKSAVANPETQNLNTVNELLLSGGGVPLKYNGMVIGAIGVAGAGGPADDQHCARAAIEQVIGK